MLVSCMTRFTFYSVILVLLITVKGFSQNPIHFFIGEKDLLNVNVYSLIEKRDGTLFAATNKGLYKYYKRQFLPIDGPTEQKGSSLFQLQRDHEDNVYCCNLSGQIFKVTNGRVSLLYEYPIEEVGERFFFVVLDNGSILAASKTIRKISPEGVSKRIPFEGNFFTFLKKSKKNGHVIIGAPIQDSLFQFHNDRIREHKIQKPLHEIESYWSYLELGKHKLAISVDGKVTSLTSSPIYTSVVPQKREKFFCIDDNSIFGLHHSKGLRELSIKGDSLVSSGQYFSNLFISAISKSINGTLFLGTFGKGVIVIPNKDVLQSTFEEPFDFTSMTINDSGDIFVSTRSGKILKLDNTETLQLIDHVNNNNIDYVYAFRGMDKDFLSIHGSLLFNVPGSKEPYGVIKDVYRINDKMILMATSKGLFSLGKALNDNWGLTRNESVYRFLLDSSRCKSVAYNNRTGDLIYSTNQGTYLSKKNEKHELTYENRRVIASDIECINGHYIIGTQKFGLLTIKEGLLTRYLPKHAHAIDNFIDKIVHYGNHLIIDQLSGLIIIDTRQKTIKKLGVAEGLKNQSIIDVQVFDNRLYALSNNALLKFPLNGIDPPKTSLTLILDSVLVNDQRQKSLELLDLDFNQNKVKFFIDVPNVLPQDEARVMYRLKGLESRVEELNVETPFISYKSLPSGDYIFEVYLSYRGEKSSVQRIDLHISPPFWKTWWFITLLFLFLLSMIIAMFIIRLKYINKRNEKRLKDEVMERKMLASRLQTLRSQMNPHFIFNSLNSIQALVLKEDTDRSYDYIVIFSDLVRMTLDYSNEDFISLEKEVEYLELYLSLQKLRFKSDFDYLIEDKVAEDAQVPTLIIQPFIENALLHGLMHKSGPKKLNVVFESKGESLFITILDNGIGRKKSEEIRKRQGRQYESFSTQAINERMGILRKKYEGNIGYEIIDLYDEQGDSSGTKVVIEIPLIMTLVK